MTLIVDEFIRRFLLHVLPRGLHRIRYYGFFANALRARNLIRAQALLGAESQCAVAESNDAGSSDDQQSSIYICPLCSAPMLIIESFERGQQPRAPPIRCEAK